MEFDDSNSISIGELPYLTTVTGVDALFLVGNGTDASLITRADFITAMLPFMQGEKGDTGLQGVQGPKGEKGDTGNNGPTGATGVAGPTGATGPSGTNGNNGWSPILAVVTDGSRRVLQLVNWTGGTGTKPSFGNYIGPAGLVANIVDAVDIRGATGATGAAGSNGSNGTNGADGADGADGSDAKQITDIDIATDGTITTTFTDATFVTSNTPDRKLGWASYQDTAYTSGSPFTLLDGIKTTLPNNSGTTLNTYLPTGVTNFYANGTLKITPQTIGDGYHFTIRFTAVPSAINMHLLFGIDIGAGTDIFQKTVTLPRGAGVANPVSIDVQGYSLSNFVTNGGFVKLTASGGNCSIYGVEYQIHRTSTP